MDDLQTPAASQTELSNLKAQCQDLQQMVTSLLLIMIVISGTLTIFLARQWRFVKGELENLTPQVGQLMMDYTNNYAMTQDFLKKVAEYGRTHPDFAPIMNKYRLTDASPKPGTTPVTSSLPGAAGSKK